MKYVICAFALLGAATTHAAAPEFCGTYTARGSDQLWDSAKQMVAADKNWEKENTYNYVGMGFCDKPDDPARKKLLEEWRAQYAAATGERPEDFEEAIRTTMRSYNNSWDPQAEYCKQFKPDEDAIQDDKDLANATGSGVGCGDAGVSAWAIDYAQISELARASYLKSCLDLDDSKDSASYVVAWCWADMKAFEESKFDAEAKEKGNTLYGRRALRSLKEDVLAKKKTWTERLDGLVKKDADWKKLMDAADSGFKKWVADYEKFKTELEDAKKYSRILESDDPRPAKGCSTTMRKHLGTYMASKKPKGFEDAIAAMTDPVGTHLSFALARCDVVDKLPAEAVAIFYKPGGSGGLDSLKIDAVRGPRYAQYSATLAALADVRSERPKFAVEKIRASSDRWYDMTQRIQGEAIGQNLGSIRGGGGLIQSVKPGKDGVTVVFKSYKVKIDDYQCKDTGRISRIYADGTVEYERNCKVTGSHQETRKTDPIVIPKEHAAGLKPGLTMYFMAFTDGKNRAGVPLAVYKDQKMKDMVSYLGIKL